MRSAATANQSVEKLSTHIAEWILDPTNKKAFADAIKLGKATYERERQELINAVKGAVPVASRQRALRSTAPEPWAQDAGSIALQEATKLSLDTIVRPPLAHSKLVTTFDTLYAIESNIDASLVRRVFAMLVLY